jgi:hypothetical protein
MRWEDDGGAGEIRRIAPLTLVVMPAEAGIHIHSPCLWIPAYAGMTLEVNP